MLENREKDDHPVEWGTVPSSHLSLFHRATKIWVPRELRRLDRLKADVLLRICMAWFSPVPLRVSGPSQPRCRTSKPFGNPMSSRPLVVWWSRAMETIGPFRHWGSILGGPGVSPATWGHDGLFVAPKMFRCVFNPPICGIHYTHGYTSVINWIYESLSGCVDGFGLPTGTWLPFSQWMHQNQVTYAKLT